MLEDRRSELRSWAAWAEVPEFDRLCRTWLFGVGSCKPTEDATDRRRDPVNDQKAVRKLVGIVIRFW